MKKVLLLFAFFGAVFLSCKKEPEPEVYGEWETISAVGFKWEYRIEESGIFCRTLPEYFDTLFCFNFDQNGDTLTVEANPKEVWKWDFEGQNVAVVTVEIAGEQPQTIILRRK